MIDRGVRLFLCCLYASVFLAFLVSCSSDSPGTGSSLTSSPVAITKTNSDAQAPLAPISALPPGSAERPLLPGQSGTTYTPDGMPALLPSKGISADQLFAEKIKDENKRMDRIENAIIDLKREFDAVKPAIIRLSAVESDMQDLIVQLQNLTGTPPSTTVQDEIVAGDIVMPQPALETPETVKPLATQKAAPAVEEKAVVPVTPGMRSVTGIRSGVHEGAARLVLDITGSGGYTADLDNTERVLVIELPGTGWSTEKEGAFKKAPLLKSWSAKPSGDGKGTIVAIALNSAAEIAYEKVLPGKNGAGQRLVIDLK